MAKLDTFNDPFDFHIRTLPEPNPDIQTLRVYTNEGVITQFKNLTHDTYEIVGFYRVYDQSNVLVGILQLFY